MRRPLPALALATIVTLSGVGVTGCGGDDDAAAPTTSSSETPTTASTAAPTTEAPATTAAGTTAATTAPPTTEVDSGGSAGSATTAVTTAPATTPATTAPDIGGDCLVGQWLITEDELNAYYDTIEAGVPGATFTITGTTGLEFTDSTYVYTPAFTLELEVAGTTGTGETSGTVTGTYTTEDGVLFSELTDGAIDIQVDVGGVVMDGSDIGNGYLNSVPFIESPFSCDGPTIMFETTDDGRHPVRLTPAG